MNYAHEILVVKCGHSLGFTTVHYEHSRTKFRQLALLGDMTGHSLNKNLKRLMSIILHPWK